MIKTLSKTLSKTRTLSPFPPPNTYDYKSLVGGKFLASDGGNYGIYVVGYVPEQLSLVVLTIRGRDLKVQYDEPPRLLTAKMAMHLYDLKVKDVKFASLVVYNDGHETLVCAVSDEQKLIDEYFGEFPGRNTDHYDRDVIHGIVEINSRSLISGSRKEVAKWQGRSHKKASKKASKKACVA
jgi:hypothetical protein